MPFCLSTGAASIGVSQTQCKQPARTQSSEWEGRDAWLHMRMSRPTVLVEALRGQTCREQMGRGAPSCCACG